MRVAKGKKKQTAKKRNQIWGPIIPERKSKRQPQNGVSMLETAQALKKKSNLEVTEGNTHFPALNSSRLLDVASKIAVDVGSQVENDSGSHAEWEWRGKQIL